MSGGEQKPLLRALAGEVLARPPWWLMRQAGRYLPEYREVRAKAGDFVSLCLNPELASEVTLQPVRRFGMDAAILFSDILLVPWAFGQKLGFHGDGPVLEAIGAVEDLTGLNAAGIVDRLSPVFETVRRVKAALPTQTALIGFAGAPWTVATYMVEGGTSRDFQKVRAWSYRDPEGFAALINLLAEATEAFLAVQIEAGVDVVQMFDSWAGVLSESGFRRWVLEPTSRIVSGLKHRFPQCRIIGFPRGAGLNYERYAAETGVDAVGLDTTVPLGFAGKLQSLVVVQGNLDPMALVVGGKPLTEAVAKLRDALAGGPYVFNLGHGILPTTPPEHVAELARLLAE